MIASTRKKLIIWLDTTLLIIFLLLLSPRLTGLALHEILGLIFFVPVLIHLLLAWTWIQNTVKRFFSTTSKRTRFNFFLNAILFILVIIELVSGTFISQVVLPGFGIKTINDSAWRAMHNVPLNFTALFLALHVALNWGWIVSIFKKQLNVSKQTGKRVSSKNATILSRMGIIIFAAALIAFAVYGMLGKPSVTRLQNRNEIARFSPTLDHGMIQFFGEAFLIAIVAFIARKWLRVKL